MYLYVVVAGMEFLVNILNSNSRLNENVVCMQLACCLHVFNMHVSYMYVTCMLNTCMLQACDMHGKRPKNMHVT